MNFDDVLKRIKSQKNLRYDYQVAELLGLTKSALAERKSRGSLPLDKISIFCERNRLNIKWVLTGEGEQSQLNASTTPGAGCALVDVFSLAAPDGARRLTGTRVTEAMAVPHGFATEGVAAVVLKGDSMEPSLYDGAILGVDGADRALVNGRLYAVWLVHEGAAVRRAYIETEQLILKADNSRYAPVVKHTAAANDGLILGRVRWVIQKL
ncbi:MAG: helix-turn-helix transcriptional regulator [Deltaproteobacteria bacterium]|nr:helix-turn-helix transcriptional regulator [Deltaproteobacteria bacterium]